MGTDIGGWVFVVDVTLGGILGHIPLSNTVHLWKGEGGKEDSFINARASTRSLNTNFKKSFDGAIVNFITPGVLE